MRCGKFAIILLLASLGPAVNQCIASDNSSFEELLDIAEKSPVSFSPFSEGEPKGVQDAIAKFDAAALIHPDHPENHKAVLGAAKLLSSTLRLDLLRQAEERLLRAIEKNGLESDVGRSLARYYVDIQINAFAIHSHAVDISTAMRFSQQLIERKGDGADYLYAVAAAVRLHALSGNPTDGLELAATTLKSTFRDSEVRAGMEASRSFPGPGSPVAMREIINGAVLSIEKSNDLVSIKRVLHDHPLSLIHI